MIFEYCTEIWSIYSLYSLPFSKIMRTKEQGAKEPRRKGAESKQSLIHMLTPLTFVHFNININQPEKSDDIVEHLQWDEDGSSVLSLLPFSFLYFSGGRAGHSFSLLSFSLPLTWIQCFFLSLWKYHPPTLTHFPPDSHHANYSYIRKFYQSEF